MPVLVYCPLEIVHLQKGNIKLEIDDIKFATITLGSPYHKGKIVFDFSESARLIIRSRVKIANKCIFSQQDNSIFRIGSEMDQKWYVCLGTDGSDGIMPNGPTYFSLGTNSVLSIGNDSYVSCGISFRVDTNSRINIGHNVFVNSNCFFRSSCLIDIDNDSIFGWGVQLNTSDGHKMFDSGIEKVCDGNIIIGKHVWVAADAKICKATCIADNCVVACNSVVNKSFCKNNCLIGGIPAKVIKEEITWTK